MKDCTGTPDCDGSELNRETYSLHDKLSAQLSLSSSDGLLVSTASLGPEKEVPSNILHGPLKNLKQDPAKEEEVTNWRLESNGFPFVVSDSELYADSSCDSSASEQTSAISSPCKSLAAYSDTQFEDLDRADIWVSSLDLDMEDSALLPDKEHILDIFSSDFPSPSFRAMTSLQLVPSCTSPRTLLREEASNPDDPIFWPFDHTLYNSPEFDKFLCVSPRRNTSGIRYGQVRQLNPVQRLQKNNLSSAIRSTKQHRSSMDLASKGAMASEDKTKKAATVPSRFSRPSKVPASSNLQPARNCEKQRPPHLKICTSKKVGPPQLQEDQPRQETKAGNARNLVEKKSAIEELIGLDEFDGHEGITSNSKDYQFSLWLSPR